MKQLTLILCAALLAGACSKKDDAAPSASAPAQQAAAGKADAGAAAIATVETADYVIKVHRAVPFVPTAAQTAGMLLPKDGNHYVALDMSVRSKAGAPLEMGTIMLQSQIVDDAGKSYGGTIPVLAAYQLVHPSPTQEDEHGAIWGMEYAPGAVHRAAALGFEAPKDVRSFTIRFPLKANSNEKAEAKFSL